jgi:hypothetical protein
MLYQKNVKPPARFVWLDGKRTAIGHDLIIPIFLPLVKIEVRGRSICKFAKKLTARYPTVMPLPLISSFVIVLML